MQSTTAIDEAVEGLAQLLRKAKADRTQVQAITHKLEQLVLPARSAKEVRAHQRVQDTLAAQRAVALLRTEAKLHSLTAERGAGVVQRLQSAKLADSDDFRRAVIEPAAAETARIEGMAHRAAEEAVVKEDEFVTLRREATCAVSVLLAETEKRFDESFQTTLSYASEDGVRGFDASDAVHEICQSIEQERKGTVGHIHQPLLENKSATSPEYLAWLRNQAQAALSSDPPSSFRSMANNLATMFNGTASIAPIKGYERTTVKAQEKYCGDYSLLLDLARGMIVFENLPSLASALQHLKRAHDQQQLRIVRAKDRLSPLFDASRFTNGYRDVLLNISFDGGHIVEIQLHIAEFLKIKNGRGHVDYEAARSIHVFNEAFSHCSFRWLPESSEGKVNEVLRDVRDGAIRSLNMDYSEGLWSSENQSRLAEACLSDRCRVRTLSLRSCRCGDDFIFKCLPLDDEDLWSPENRPVCNTVRLGSKLHEGTAGRISGKGIALVLRYLNNCLRVLDLEGCLDLDWAENVGDTVAETIDKHVRRYAKDGKTALPQLQELNLQNTGLTSSKGMAVFDRLKKDGHLKTTKIITDSQLRDGPPRQCFRGASSRILWDS
ncbi:hypothetical protein ACHAXT_012820 [Thalassiosira profunda]